MTWVDIVCVVILVWFAFSGFTMGLIRSIFRFLALIIAIGVTWLFTSPFSSMLHSIVPSLNSWALKPTIAVLLFIIFFLMTTVLGRILSEQLEKNGMGGLDQFAGLGIGVLKAWILSCIFVSIVAAIPTESAELTRTKSFFYKYYTAHSIGAFKNLWSDNIKSKNKTNFETGE